MWVKQLLCLLLPAKIPSYHKHNAKKMGQFLIICICGYSLFMSTYINISRLFHPTTTLIQPICGMAQWSNIHCLTAQIWSFDHELGLLSVWHFRFSPDSLISSHLQIDSKLPLVVNVYAHGTLRWTGLPYRMYFHLKPSNPGTSSGFTVNEDESIIVSVANKNEQCLQTVNNS